MKNTDKVTLTVGQLKKLIKENVRDDYNAVGKLSLVRRAFEYLFLRKMQECINSEEFEDFAFQNFEEALADVRREGTYADVNFEIDKFELEKMFSEFVKDKAKQINAKIDDEISPTKHFKW